MTSRWIIAWAWLWMALLISGPARSEEICRTGGPAAMALLFQYLGLDPRTEDEQALLRTLAARHVRVEYVVATVPDPMAPGLGSFDQTLDALTLALEARNEFRLDRYSFPWQFTEDPENRGQSKVTIAQCHDGEPGVILYRHAGQTDNTDSGPERLLLLFLVPERPTSGIEQRAFHNALAQVRALRERDLEVNGSDNPVLDEPPDEDTRDDQPAPPLLLRVVGPRYSGAAVSLRKALQQALDEKDPQGRPIWRKYKFDIISGSASNKTIKPLLEKDYWDHIRFRATVIPDFALEASMRRYLQDNLGARPQEIAILTETTTAYGQGFIRGLDAQLVSVWSDGSGEAWAVGKDGQMLHRKPAGGWVPEPRATEDKLWGVWGGGGSVWIVGDRGTIRRRSGTRWEAERNPVPGRSCSLLSVWGSGPQEVWAVGSIGTLLRRDSTGTWSDVDGGTAHALNGVAGRGEDVWFVGDRCTVLHRDRGSPAVNPVRTPPGLCAAGPDAGEDPSVPWRPVRSNLEAVWVDPQRGHVWVVGTAGVILRRDGQAGTWRWLAIDREARSAAVMNAQQDLYGVSGHEGEVWAVGQRGTILHYSDRTGQWQPEDSHTTQDLLGVWAGPSAGPGSPVTVWAVGRGDTLLRRTVGPQGPAWAQEQIGRGQDLDQTPLVLPFPMHISRLASEWEQEEKERRKAESRDRSAPRAPADALSRTQGAGDRPDLLPSAAPRETSAQEDLALIHILNSIAVEKIRFVGLYATSTDDKRFLAQRIRQFAPDVVLFTLGTHLLYTHPEDRNSFGGMLVAGTYPLFNKNQQWSYPHTGREQRIQFADEAAQGTYNAMLAHLGKIEYLLEYTSPLEVTNQNTGEPLVTAYQGRDPEAFAQNFRPPVWISVVGNGALVPFQYDSQYADEGFVYHPSATEVQPLLNLGRDPGRLDSGVLAVSMLALGLCCLLHCIAFFWTGAKLPNPLQFMEVFRRAPQGSEAGRPWLYLLACFGALLLGYGGIFALFAWHLVGPDPVMWGCAIVTAVGWGVLWVVVLRLLRLPWPAAVAWSCTVIALCWAGIAHLSTNRAWMAYLLLFSRRGEYPGYGLSLLLPFLLLCGVLYFWGLSQLNRMRLMEKARLLEAVVPHGESLKLGEIEDRLRPYMSGRLRPEYYLLLSIPLGCAWYFFIGHVLTLDHVAANWIFRGLLFLAVAFITVAFARLLAMWQHIRILLRRLSSQPLAGAYQRVPEAFSRPLGMQIVEDIPREVEIEALRWHVMLIRNHLGQVLAPPPPAAPVVPAAAGAPGRPQDTLEYLREKMHGPLTELKNAAEAVQTAPEEFEDSLREPPRSPFYQFSETVAGALRSVWQGRPLKIENEPLIKEVAGAKSTYDAYLRYLPDAAHVLLRLVEDFLAIQGVIYINHLFLHLRNLLTFVTASMLCLIGAVSLYPFQPHHLLMVLIGLIVVPVVAVFLVVFLQMNRNEVLSRISGTRPGKVDLDRSFVIQVALYAVVPLLGLAAAQFPLIGGYILSWLEPVLRPLLK